MPQSGWIGLAGACKMTSRQAQDWPVESHAHCGVALSTTRIPPSPRMAPCVYTSLPVNFISGVLDTVEPSI